ncbi:MAG: PIN domain-containing protein [Rhizobiaceae bacterium]
MSVIHVVEVFFDSNALLYVHDKSNSTKVEMATHWLEQISLYESAATNLQVLNEVTNVLFKKRKDLSIEAVFTIVDDLAYLGASPLTWREVQTARGLRISTGYSWWDCLLLASALELGCSHFLSEDLQDGQQIGDLMIINPFLHAPEDILGPVQD